MISDACLRNISRRISQVDVNANPLAPKIASAPVVVCAIVTAALKLLKIKDSD